MGQSASTEDSQLEGIIRVLLMGKRGHGKSATGNFLLNRKVFKTSSNMTSQTKYVTVGHARFKNVTLTVVDGPGLEDTDINKVSDKAAAEKNIGKALAMFPTGVDAFLLVIKFGVKFTKQEVSELETLKALLGYGYYSHVIVVVTFGDLYDIAMAEETCSSSFEEWCSAQTGEFKQLFEDCSGRVVLFNNTEKNEEKRQAKIEQLVQLARGQHTRHGRYNSKCFEKAKVAREKLILEHKAPILKEEIQVDISLLTADIERFSKHPSSRSRQNISKSINDLKREIQIQDKGYGVLADLLILVEDVENNLQDVIEHQRLTKELEKQEWQTQMMRKKVKLNFLLMGKTGHGKSATGNSILNRIVFESSSSMTSVTKDVRSAYAKLEDYTLLVVDGPGLEDTDISQVENTEAAVKNMTKAVAMCSEGVDAFLFVTRFGIRFTAEDVSALETLKYCFGDNYFKYIILVVTGEDLFQVAMKNEHREDSFDEWCRKQTGPFRQLYDDCKGRVVLLNNIEKNEEKRLAQIQQIVQLAHDLHTRHGRYTAECFEKGKAERMILERKAPMLSEEIQEKICFITATIEQLSTNPSNSERRNIEKLVTELKHDIEAHGEGLDELLKLAEKVEIHLHDTVELRRLGKRLEHLRVAEKVWDVIGTVFTVVGGVLTFVSPLIGRVVAAVGSGVCATGHIIIKSMEHKAKEKQRELQANINI